MNAETYQKLSHLLDEKREGLLKLLNDFFAIPGKADWELREKAYGILESVDKIDKYIEITKKTFGEYE